MSNTNSIYASNAFPQSAVDASITTTTSQAASTRSSAQTNSLFNTQSGNEFQDLLMILLLASSLSSLSSSGSSMSGLSGGSGEGMLSPILMQLISQPVQPSGTFRDSMVSQYGSSGVPHLKPVDGPMTQDYHHGHIGIDTGIPVGTPIKSSMAGKVVFAGWNTEGYGNLVVVENGQYKTYYAHLSDFNVEEGDAIQAGSTVGYSGNTGNSTGPHLHYEVRVNNKAVDPTSFYGQRIDTDI